MRLRDGRPVFSATDLANFLECEHLIRLDREVMEGRLVRPYFDDPTKEVLAKKGEDHERHHLEHLRAAIDGEVFEPTRELSAEAAAAATHAALARGVAVVYQGVFLDDGWYGRPDFLVRCEQPSELGPWSYVVVDTKLATHTKARAIVQLCAYSEMLGKAQGRLPETMQIVLGGNAGVETYRVADYLAYVRELRRQFEAQLDAAGVSYPEPVEHCQVCDFATLCKERRRGDDHLSLVASITRRQRDHLVEAGVRTVAALGALSLPDAPPAKVDGIGKAALARIRDQARLQVKGRSEGRVLHELITPVLPECGLASLPAPSVGDLFFDIEADPFAAEGGLEYLLGFVEAPEAAGTPAFAALWSFDPAQEKRHFERFMDLVMARLARHPDMHIYHYAPYEPTALKRLMAKHATREAEVDRLLRGGILVDLYRVVKQGVRASVESYSIKKLEPLYGFERQVGLRSATRSLQQFEVLMSEGLAGSAGRAILAEIEGYNRDDCLSTLRLRDWLEQQRGELARTTGQPVPRPTVREQEVTETRAAEDAALAIIKTKLTLDVPDDPTLRSAEQSGRWLLAQLLEWHRREDKSLWWSYYHHLGMTPEELLDDADAIGGLEYVGEVGKIKKSIVHRYRFPKQECDVRVETDLIDVATEHSPGEVVAIDDDVGTLDLKRGIGSPTPHPAAAFPHKVVQTKELRESLQRIGEWVAAHGLSAGGPYQAGLALLLRQRPALVTGGAGPLTTDEDPVTAARRLALALDRSVLPIQGPPGSGKTYTAARMIAALIAAGKKVGITANSHKVICNVLTKTVEAAREEGVTMTAVQKITEASQACDAPGVTPTKVNQDVFAALIDGSANVFAGTSWLWAREEMAAAVDVLIVDEAGQMSLANVLAVSQGAKSIILIGDPQQLEQPQKGVHPPGAGVSALTHLLDGAPTIPPDRGLFLANTRRMHPDVCRFISESFYEAKLHPLPELAQQRVDAPGRLTGTGLRFVPVLHRGNQNEAPEEVEAIAALYSDLLSGSWTNDKGKAASLVRDEVMIVAPYNAQVAALKARLGPDANVGTVDKFQGQEAAVVIFSMTTSTVDEAPRGMEFLYSPNRLNVALSRARCLAVLVGNPELLPPRCATPRQMQLANGFARFLEMAEETSAHAH